MPYCDATVARFTTSITRNNFTPSGCAQRIPRSVWAEANNNDHVRNAYRGLCPTRSYGTVTLHVEVSPDSKPSPNGRPLYSKPK
jgi:hypothetical protein